MLQPFGSHVAVSATPGISNEHVLDPTVHGLALSAGDMFPVANDRQTSGHNTLCQEDLPELCRTSTPTPSPVSSSPDTDSMWKQASVRWANELPAKFCARVHTVEILRHKCTAPAAHDAGTKSAYADMTAAVYLSL